MYWNGIELNIIKSTALPDAWKSPVKNKPSKLFDYQSVFSVRIDAVTIHYVTLNKL